MRILFLFTALMLLALAPDAAAAPIPDTAVAYCTTLDVEESYDSRALAQRTGDASGQVVDAGKLQAAIDGFASKMDPYVRARYSGVGFGQAEPTLRAINVEGAWLELAKRKPSGLSQDDREQRADLMRQLRDIASGSAELAVPAGADPSESHVDPDRAWRSNPRHFGRRAWTPPPV